MYPVTIKTMARSWSRMCYISHNSLRCQRFLNEGLLQVAGQAISLGPRHPHCTPKVWVQVAKSMDHVNMSLDINSQNVVFGKSFPSRCDSLCKISTMYLFTLRQSVTCRHSRVFKEGNVRISAEDESQNISSKQTLAGVLRWHCAWIFNPE